MSVTTGTSGGATPPPPRQTADVVNVHLDTPASAGAPNRMRWGAVWAGLVTALSSYLLLQLSFFAAGLLTLDIDPTDAALTAGAVSAVVGLLAFFLGGMVTGASGSWRQAPTGDRILNGFVLWALTVTTILLLTSLGSGALLGTLADVVTRVDLIQANATAVNGAEFDAAQALDTAREAAGWSILFLLLSMLAAIGGAVVGGVTRRGMDQAGHDDTAGTTRATRHS